MRCGKTHYPDPDDFIDEAIEHGISKAIPLGKRQDPPVIQPGVTRCWILHPDTDQGWAVIGYAYLQRVVFTEPDDGNVPQYVQEHADAGRLDVVDIEDPPGDDEDGQNASVEDFMDADGDGDTDADGSDADDGSDEPGSDDADPGGNTAETVVPAEDGSGDVQELRQAIKSADDLGYNKLRQVASARDVDTDERPTKVDLEAAIAEAGITPDKCRHIIGGDADD